VGPKPAAAPLSGWPPAALGRAAPSRARAR
jgi:hypothetical protein